MSDWWCPTCKEALSWQRVTYAERCDTCGTPVCGAGCGHEEHIATLEGQLAAVTADAKRWKLKANQLHDFCPDHRDKQRGESCLACQRDTLRAALTRVVEALKIERGISSAHDRCACQACIALTHAEEVLHGRA